MTDTLHRALAHHKAGRLEEAQSLYKRILDRNPNHPDALHLFGVLAYQAGSPEVAVETIQRAITVQGNNPAYYNSLGNALCGQQKFEEAIQNYEHAISLDSKSDEAYINLGNAFKAQGRLEEALNQYQKAKALNPKCVETYNNLGNVLKDLGQLNEAEAHYRKALQFNPQYAEAYYNLSCILADQAKTEEAVACCKKALAIFPEFLEAQLQLGLLYHEQGQYPQALTAFERVIQLNPTFVEAYNGIANSLHAQGKAEEAISIFLKAIEVNPTHADAYYNLGVLLQQQFRIEEALAMFHHALKWNPEMAPAHFHYGLIQSHLKKDDIAINHYQKALELDPTLAEAYLNLGNIYKRKNKLDEAVKQYQKALEIRSDYLDAFMNLGTTYDKMNRPEEALSHYEQAYALDPRVGLRLEIATILPGIYRSQEEVLQWRNRFQEKVEILLQEGVSIQDPLQEFGRPNFYLTYQGMNDRSLQVAFAKLFDTAPRWHAVPHGKRAKPRVGFISANFRSKHTIGKLNRGTIDRLSRDKFSVYVFTIGDDYLEGDQAPISPDDHYIKLPSDNLSEASQLIAGQELDLLLYADIGMDPLSYFLPRSRLAKVQCVTWGHPETTGHEHMDYFLSSEDFEVPHAQEHYTETLVRLKELYPYYLRPTLEAPKTREAFGYRSDEHLYTCLQSLFKFHPDFDEVLATILKQDPKGRLLLLHHQYKPYNQVLLDRWEKVMPEAMDRIQFVDRLPRKDFINLMALSDVMLDPLHFGGGNTSLEAFAFGTPVVTLPSEFLRCRLTYGYYRKMGLMDCVAQSPQKYAEIALRIGTDPDYRHTLQQKILEKNSVLFENQAAVRELEDFFTWAIHRADGEGAETPPNDIQLR